MAPSQPTKPWADIGVYAILYMAESTLFLCNLASRFEGRGTALRRMNAFAELLRCDAMRCDGYCVLITIAT